MRKTGKLKRVVWSVLDLDYKAMEVYLEDMAQRGWILKETNIFFATFEKITPKKVHFVVDVFEIPKYKGEKDPVEAKEYRDLCEAAGWHFIDGKGYLQFFYSEAEKRPKPIQTDLETEARVVSSYIWNRRIVATIFGIFLLTSMLWTHFPIGPEELMNNSNILQTLMLPSFWFYLVMILIYLILIRYQMQKKVERQEIFASRNLNKARKRAWFLVGIPLFLAVFFAVGMLGDYLGGNQGVIIALLSALIGSVTILVVNQRIQKKQRIINDDMVFQVIIISFLLLIFLIPAGLIIGETGRVQRPLPEEYPLLTGGPWGDHDEESGEFRYYTRSSILVPKHYELRYPLDQSEGVFNYSYYRAINLEVAEYLYERLLDEEGQDFREDHPVNLLWDVKRIGYRGSRNNVYILQGDEILRIQGNLDFTDPKLIDDVENIFF